MAAPRKPRRPQGGHGSDTSGRRLHVRVKTAKGRTPSSRDWLERQLNDPYVAAAAHEGWRSRSAFKLTQLDDRFGLMKKGDKVVDLGAAPGGWSQVAARRVGAAEGTGKVVAIDVHGIEPIAGVTILKKDFFDADAPAALRQALGGDEADLVVSDMAAHAIGHRQTDHLKIMALAEAALDFARQVLKPGGAFVCKVLRGGTETAMLAEMKKDFSSVRHVKPAASRADSAELFVVATGFRGGGQG